MGSLCGSASRECELEANKKKVGFFFDSESDLNIFLSVQVEEGWWSGTLNGKSGLFPSNFVKELEASGEDGESTDTVADETGREHTLYSVQHFIGLARLSSTKTTMSTGFESVNGGRRKGSPMPVLDPCQLPMF